ncbi:MAG: hypothetical protein ACYCVN_02625 [Acidimicrobiales bacterium]
MPTKTTAARRKQPMSADHKAALAQGREEGRIVRRYLQALDSTRPKRGRKRTADTIKKRLDAIGTKLPGADPLARLHLYEEKQRLEDELSRVGSTVNIAPLQKEFVKVARSYGDRKGISYPAWRAVGVSAPVLQQAKIPRTRS